MITAIESQPQVAGLGSSLGKGVWVWSHCRQSDVWPFRSNFHCKGKWDCTIPFGGCPLSVSPSFSIFRKNAPKILTQGKLLDYKYFPSSFFQVHLNKRMLPDNRFDWNHSLQLQALVTKTESRAGQWKRVGSLTQRSMDHTMRQCRSNRGLSRNIAAQKGKIRFLGLHEK